MYLHCLLLQYCRDTHGSGSNYHKELSKQLATFLERPLKVREGGGGRGEGLESDDQGIEILCGWEVAVFDDQHLFCDRTLEAWWHWQMSTVDSTEPGEWRWEWCVIATVVYPICNCTIRMPSCWCVWNGRHILCPTIYCTYMYMYQRVGTLCM